MLPLAESGRSLRRSALSAPIACGCGLAAGACWLAVVDPADGRFGLACPFRLATGLWCPACGMSRATHHLLNGRVETALRFNLFVGVVLAAIAWSWWRWVQRALGSERGRPLRPWMLATIVTVSIGFAVVRNLTEGLRG